MAFTVFLSYSKKDRDLVKAIREAAQAFDISVYTYDQDAKPGSELSRKLLDRIAASDAVVVLLTRAGAASAAVNQEIGAARQAKKLVIPILESDVDPVQLPFIQGLEYLTLNHDNLNSTLNQLSARLVELKRKRDRNALVFGLLLAGTVLWASRG